MRPLLACCLTMTSGLDGQLVHLNSCQGDIDGHLSIYALLSPRRSKGSPVYRITGEG